MAPKSLFVPLAIYDLARLIVEETVPFRVCALDQANFPKSSPLLDLFLAPYGGRHTFMHLEIDEAVDAVLLCETRDQTLGVLGHSLVKIARHANVERAEWFTG